MEQKKLLIGIYNPYFDGLGGGERYTLTLAAHWSKTHEVVLFWDDPNILGKAERRFGIDLSRVRVEPNFFAHENIFSKLWKSRAYDCIVFLSDGSIPASLAKHNILHIQVPFASVLSDPWKMGRFDAVVCNSIFTKEHLDPILAERSMVIYPPVPLVKPGPENKRKKRILSVGRFTSASQAKKQNVLIDAFLTVQKTVLKDWELVLAGGLIESDKEFFDRLKKRVAGTNITLRPNIDNEEMTSLYQTSRVYWHASGFGEENPAHMEHFGITTVEAMSAGVVPVVFAAGGQLEIVSDTVDGYTWASAPELIQKTKKLLASPETWKILSRAAAKRANDFSEVHFTRAFDALIAGWK